MKKLLIATVLLAPVFVSAQAVTPWGPYWGPRVYKDYSKMYEGRTLKKDIPRTIGIPPAPAPANTLPDAKYKITIPDTMAPKVIAPVPFYAPSQTAKPLQFFIFYDSLNKKWLEVGSADIKDVASNTAVTGAGVRLYLNPAGERVYKDGMEVYELYNLPKPKKTFDPEKSIMNFFRNIVP